jgi:hypothetical protein
MTSARIACLGTVLAVATLALFLTADAMARQARTGAAGPPRAAPPKSPEAIPLGAGSAFTNYDCLNNCSAAATGWTFILGGLSSTAQVTGTYSNRMTTTPPILTASAAEVRIRWDAASPTEQVPVTDRPHFGFARHSSAPAPTSVTGEWKLMGTTSPCTVTASTLATWLLPPGTSFQTLAGQRPDVPAQPLDPVIVRVTNTSRQLVRIQRRANTSASVIPLPQLMLTNTVITEARLIDPDPITLVPGEAVDYRYDPSPAQLQSAAVLAYTVIAQTQPGGEFEEQYVAIEELEFTSPNQTRLPTADPRLRPPGKVHLPLLLHSWP